MAIESDTTDPPAIDIDRLVERPLTIEDAGQIAEINHQMEQAEPADTHLSEADVLEELTGPTVDLTRASSGLFDGDLLVGYTAIAAIADATAWKAHLDGGVRTAWTRRGLGGRLLRTAESQARAWKEEKFPELPGELSMWLEQSRVSTAALADAEGFETFRYFFRMQRDLAQPVQKIPPAAGFTIRPYMEADADPVRLARNDAFADHWGSLESSPERWQAHMVGAQAFRPQQSFVAVVDSGGRAGRIAAFVMAEEFDAETTARGYRTGYIALVGTVREARGNGLASALLARQLQSMQDDGYQRAELGVDSDSPTGAGRIYQRSGFVELERNRVAGMRFGPATAGG